jgi:hypothetical protein
MNTCSKCGSSLTTDLSFCPNCGAPTPSYYSRTGASTYDATIAASSSVAPTLQPPTDYGSNPYSTTLQNPYDQSPYLQPPPPPPPPPTQLRGNRRFIILIGTILLVLILLGAGIFTLLTRKNAPLNTNTPLFTADWSSGLNGWTGSSEWSAANGELISNGHWSGDLSAPATTGGDAIMSPYQPSTADYALQARMRVLSTPDKCWLALRGRVRNDGSGYSGYFVGYDAYYGGGNIAYFDPSVGFDSLEGKSYDPGFGWHIYRAEFRGNEIILRIDGYTLLQVTDSANTNAGQVGLESGDCRIEVSSFKVFAL